ncbi:MAG: CBS domain-containing protein [Chitinophagaceae bacterium]|jgi:CBS domain-containing protein|nr:CBS domain-containing protein [Chitinophagaceae bacterium]
MRTVQEIIDAKPAVYDSISPDTTVIDALTMLNSLNRSYVIVKEGDAYKGIFCEKDYTRNVILRGRSSRNTTVSEVMTVDLPTVSPDDTVPHCVEKLMLHKCRYLLVFDEGNFKGVITMQDLLREALRSRVLSPESVY